jgi:hypothetical protein
MRRGHRSETSISQPARKTIFASASSEAPTAVLAAALERLELGADSFAERANYLVAELQRHGYRIKRR